jgi:hypothetical protein
MNTNELINDCIYECYKYNRLRNPELTVEQWGKVFKNVTTLEEKFKKEHGELICVRKTALIKCKVQVTPNHSEIVWAESLAEAPEIAWNRIKDGYAYGYYTKERFLKAVTVTEVE